MNQKLLDKCQQMVEIGQIEQVADIVTDELRANLTDEQFKLIGDARSLFIDTFNSNPIFTVKQFVYLTIQMFKSGYILKKKEQFETPV
ncbi:hypothetical protein EZS27_026085 [termite gut metagenome]|uniref:Uncharacterized protein n=1 Tax=termite gut metagenome TaxID=433724 RepID=A0A5J4QUZ8_9ZZZZ